VLCSRESPFADCLPGAPSCDYLSRAILPCRGAPITDTAYMGLTSCPMDHDHGNDRTPATRCAIGIKPAAASLSNAPPTATPSSVMGRFHLLDTHAPRRRGATEPGAAFEHDQVPRAERRELQSRDVARAWPGGAFVDAPSVLLGVPSSGWHSCRECLESRIWQGRLVSQADLYPGVPSRSLLRASCCSCRSCTPDIQSNVADGPTRGSSGAPASRKA
jgi:hypothetical protein